MRVFALSTLREFWEDHADAESPLREWYRAVVGASWSQPNNVKQYASSVSIISNERICFNIKGNDYRLLVSVDYPKQFVFVLFIGTHAQYDKIDAETVTFGEVAK